MTFSEQNKFRIWAKKNYKKYVIDGDIDYLKMSQEYIKNNNISEEMSEDIINISAEMVDDLL